MTNLAGGMLLWGGYVRETLNANNDDHDGIDRRPICEDNSKY
jgi:hypothetical protein